MPAAFIFAGALAVFSGIWATGTETDIQLHTEKLREINAGTAQWTPNFLLYLLVGALSGFSTDFDVLMRVMITVLAGAVAGKFIVTRTIIRQAVAKWAPGRAVWLPGGATGVAALLTIAYLLPGGGYVRATNMYLYRVVPNVWHNSTIIAVFPFALLLFWEQYKVLEPATTGPPPKLHLKRLTLLVLLNIVIKPSFFFVYAVATPLLALYHERRLNRVFWRRLLPVVAGGVAMGVQAGLIYLVNYGSYDKEPSGLRFQPLGFVHWILQSTAIDLVLTYAVPLAALLLLGRRLARRRLVYAGLLAFLGLLIATSLFETGPRAHHGNFAWQNVLTTYITWLMAVVLVATVPAPVLTNSPISPNELRPVRDWRLTAFWAVVWLQGVAGLSYIIRLLIEHRYK